MSKEPIKPENNDVSSAETPEPLLVPAPPKKIILLKSSDYIAILALLASIFGIGWQIRDAVLGSDAQFLKLSGRVAEIRCHSGKAETCWGTEDGTREPTGRLAVILPALFVNKGAAQQHEVITRIEVLVSAKGQVPTELKAILPVTLVANSFWTTTQSGGSANDRPFEPILIEGRSAAGSEVRLISFDPKSRLPWAALANAMADGTVTELVLELRAETAIEESTLVEVCRFQMNDRLRSVLLDRINERQSGRITTVCK